MKLPRMRRKGVYKMRGKKRRLNPLVLAGVALLIILAVGVVRVVYTENLRPVSSTYKIVYFTVQPGDSVKIIAANLKSQGLIRNSGAFETYVRGHGLFGELKAGTYLLSPSMSVQQIVKKMVDDDVAKHLLTILPGKRLQQIQKVFLDAGYSQVDVDSAFSAYTYAGDPALSTLAPGQSLEGYLYPDSFQQTSDTPASTIVKESIDEMGTKLTPDIVSSFRSEGLSTYQGITLASIVYQESDNPAYEPRIAQVFLTRLGQGMPLQSNVTANYAADSAGVARTTAIQSPYNTYLHKGLPPGPIGTLTATALAAVAHPTNTDDLYFVADEKSGVVYFAKTQDQQNSLAKQHCPNTCQTQ